MIRILLLSHSDLAESLLRTGKMICGKKLMEDIVAFTLKEDGKGINELKMMCQRFYDQNRHDHFLIFTDIVNASPFNVCVSVFYNADYYIVTGMNLPMLIDTAIKREHSTLEELALSASKAGKEGIEKIKLMKDDGVEVSEEDFL